MIHGWEVDKAVREFITGKGYGDYFIHSHRTLRLAATFHANGANLDNLETKDDPRDSAEHPVSPSNPAFTCPSSAYAA